MGAVGVDPNGAVAAMGAIQPNLIGQQPPMVMLVLSRSHRVTLTLEQLQFLAECEDVGLLEVQLAFVTAVALAFKLDGGGSGCGHGVLRVFMCARGWGEKFRCPVLRFALGPFALCTYYSHT